MSNAILYYTIVVIVFKKIPEYVKMDSLSRALTRSNFNTEVFSDKSKESAGEIDLAVLVNWHVHPNQFLIC